MARVHFNSVASGNSVLGPVIVHFFPVVARGSFHCPKTPRRFCCIFQQLLAPLGQLGADLVLFKVLPRQLDGG